MKAFLVPTLVFTASASFLYAQAQWFMRPSGTSYGFCDVAYGNGVFLAVTYGCRVSTDGITWTPSSISVSTPGPTTAYGNGVFMITDYWGHRVLVSTDHGITSTPRLQVGNSIYLNDIAYGNGIWVTVASNGGIWRSADNGVTWAPALTPTSNDLYGVTFGNGIFMAVGWQTVATSPDGYAWTLQPSPPPYLDKVTFANGSFIGVQAFFLHKSTDNGASWVQVFQQPANQYLRNIHYANGMFIAVGDSGIVYSSTNGTTWTARNSGTTFDYTGAAYGNGSWVVVGANGNIISATADTVQPTLVPNVQISAGIILRWQTQSGLFYQVRSSSDLSTWQNVGAPIAGDGTEKTFFTESEGQAKAFYRIEVK